MFWDNLLQNRNLGASLDGASLVGASVAVGDSGSAGASLAPRRSSAARRRLLRDHKIRHDLGLNDPDAGHSLTFRRDWRLLVRDCH